MERDYLTNLPNRRSLYQYYLGLPQDMKIHAMFLDVDNFKKANDIHGHNMGDQLLVCIANFLQGKDFGFVARLGGDEFVILMDGIMPTNQVPGLVEQLLVDFKKMDFRKDVLSLVSLSVGVIRDQAVTQPLDDILEKCDNAMYQAKMSGKNRYAFYSELDSILEVNRKLEKEMEEAMQNGDFQIDLQPKINMVTSELYGVEALSRWVHPVEGIRPPKVYIDLFEKNGFITKLDLHIYEEVCKLKASWKGTKYEHIPVSVNMSRLHLYDRVFPERLEAIAKRYEVDLPELEMEITESTFVKDSDELIAVVSKLKEKGFLVSIDDFGSGFSALYLLKDLPVDTIKIDRGFLQSSTNDARGKTVLRNIITMCKDLKMDVVTEGIETKEQVNFVISCGCQIAQGFFYAKPMPVSEFYEFAEGYIGNAKDNHTFRLNGSLVSEDGSMEGQITGQGIYFAQGIFSDSSSLYFPGGGQEENIVVLPNDIIVSDSFTISMWIRPKSVTAWTSALFVKFESGFCSIVPYAWEGNSCCRLRDATVVNGWYDIASCQFRENTWYHYVITYNAKTEVAVGFVNGEPVGRLENVPTNRFVNLAYIGGDMYQPSFHGNICELIFYNEAKDYDFVKKLHLSYTESEKFIAFDK